MNNLFVKTDPRQEAYTLIYRTLSELREGFHRSGRLDDSNAKLDEILKLFATYLAFKKHQIAVFPQCGSLNIVHELQTAFAATARLPQYLIQNGDSIFGPQPSVALRPGDEALANSLAKLVRNSIDFAFNLRSEGSSFDVLNEAFGHFVRDNFRSNVEDAQYMTPPEVVDFMVDLVLNDIACENQEKNYVDKHWTILDPSCGVGSFLTAIYQRSRRSNWLAPESIRLFGQDKVERMVRLSTINLELFEVEEHRITIGNSLERRSPIDDLNGEVDIILTNPPFGARFDPRYVAMACGDNTPFFSALHRSSAYIYSEMLFIDRNLQLLREGGRLLIVVPDGVVSAKGMAALLRHHLASVTTIRAIVEFPSVTFAQAGTRTKTAMLYLQKVRNKKPARVFMAVSKDLGFQVSSRKGIQIKIANGKNDLTAILAVYRDGWKTDDNEAVKVLCKTPSCVVVPEATVLRSSWTPNHYSAARFETIINLRKNPDFDLVQLGDLVDFCSDTRRAEARRQGCAYISILHILGEGFVDIGGALSYDPKTPGLPIQPGELLLSRINPRIPRVCITPDFGIRTLCSSEFEVMKARNSVNVYTLAYLLQTEVIQNQIRSLTSGTSASHNRIRTAELASVWVPIPKRRTKKNTILNKTVREYRTTLEALNRNATILANIRRRDIALFDL